MTLSPQATEPKFTVEADEDGIVRISVWNLTENHTYLPGSLQTKPGDVLSPAVEAAIKATGIVQVDQYGLKWKSKREARVACAAVRKAMRSKDRA